MARLYFTETWSAGFAMPLPRLNDVAEIRWLHVAVRPICRDSDPGLCAARPDVTDREKPAGVVQIACLHNRDFGIRPWFMKQPAAAFRANDAINHSAALVLALPHSRLALLDSDRASVGKQRKAEGTA